MSRHNSLIPLSHDHHEALLIALRLKKGGPTSPHDTLWPKDLQSQIRSLLIFCDRELLPHFMIEENLLFPLALKMEELHLLVTQLLDDHNEFRNEIENIRASKTSEMLIPMLKNFGINLEAHIRKEERLLFPKLEEAEGNGRIILPVLK